MKTEKPDLFLFEQTLKKDKLFAPDFIILQGQCVLGIIRRTL